MSLRNKENSRGEETAGAWPLHPTSPCGAHNRTPRSQLPVLTAAPTPACCFPPCGRSQALPFVKGGRSLFLKSF